MGFYSSLMLLIPGLLIFYTFTGERPQLFSFLFSFVLIFLLEGFRKSVLEKLQDSQVVIARSEATKQSQDTSTVTQQDRRAPLAMTAFSISHCEDRSDAAISSLSHSTPFLYLLPLPFIMLLWANLHGGFILGLAILFGYIVSEAVKFKLKRFGPILPFRALKWLSATVIASVLLSLVNPNTYKVIPFLV
ncbi:MAG: hypothetical protein RDU20_23975, partial [Desulfomonilaceae bacterium]|nr:hypothetical protein [Desulfomonilaceae bacterium]